MRVELSRATNTRVCSLALVAALCMSLASCVRAVAKRGASDTSPPAALIGRFADDYGDVYDVSREQWAQTGNGRYRIVEWNSAQQYLIAQNDSANRTDGGKWTRIDWLTLQGMAPYGWGFCMTAWSAPTRDSARATAPARRDIPRTGCGGFPFTRMRPSAANF